MQGCLWFQGILGCQECALGTACWYSECRLQIQSGFDLLALKRCLKAHDVAPAVINAVVHFYTESEMSEDCDDFLLESIVTAYGIYETVDFYHPDLETEL